MERRVGAGQLLEVRSNLISGEIEGWKEGRLVERSEWEAESVWSFFDLVN